MRSSPRQDVLETPCGMKDCTKNDFGECIATEKRRDNCPYLAVVEALREARCYVPEHHGPVMHKIAEALKAVGEEI